MMSICVKSVFLLVYSSATKQCNICSWNSAKKKQSKTLIKSAKTTLKLDGKNDKHKHMLIYVKWRESFRHPIGCCVELQKTHTACSNNKAWTVCVCREGKALWTVSASLATIQPFSWDVGQVQHKPLITGLLLTTLQAEAGKTTLTQSTTLKHFHGRVNNFYTKRLPAKIIWI